MHIKVISQPTKKKDCSHRRMYSSRGPEMFRLQEMNTREAASRLHLDCQPSCRGTISH